MKIKAQDKHAKVLFYLFTQMQRFETVSETACGVGPFTKSNHQYPLARYLDNSKEWKSNNH